MEWFRWESNPWGQELLIGLSWDVGWVAVAVGVLFAVLHAVLYHWRWRPDPNRAAPAQGGSEGDGAAGGDPGRVLRHSLVSRVFHWVMAATVLALLFTAFLPILGLKFPWVTAHWVAGLVLTGAIVFHMVHATFWKGLALMWITRKDLRDGWLAVRQIAGIPEPAPGKPGKNPLENKLFHHATALATVAVIVTGLLMMVRVDGPFWTRNPYLLPDATWGWIYVAHGAASVGFITLIMTHLYFAARPEKRWITLSMIVGWIPRRRYLEHYDPRHWSVGRRTEGGENALLRVDRGDR